MKPFPVWAGLVVLIFGVLGSAAFAARSSGETGGMQPLKVIAQREYAVNSKGLQWLGMANHGEWSNPDDVNRWIPELEYPGSSGTVFLFTGGVWVGAVRNGIRIVSTATDADNGTGEYGALEFGTVEDRSNPLIQSIGWLEKTKDPVTVDDQENARTRGIYLGIGSKEKDDDGDCVIDYDVNADGGADSDFDGKIGTDDDQDGVVDEEILNGVDDDDDGLIDEDVGDIDDAWVSTNASGLAYLNDDPTKVVAGDANGDGLQDYDPEPMIDEDPAGDISLDYQDNDFDGLFDGNDPDYDGDAVPGSLDDDGDGLEDEDDLARAGQEFIVSFADTCENCIVSEDTDGFTPLGVRVVQHSYQWAESFADDFILMDFEITNIGNSILYDICLGTFFDFDVGHLTQESSARSEDDYTYYIDDQQMAVGGDADGDDGLLEARVFGVRVIQTPVEEVQAAYQNFERLSGGDPEDNAAKYELMSSGSRDPDAYDEGDWRFVLAFGPIGDLNPGETLPVTIAIVNGFTEAEILVNGEQAKAMFDVDFRGPSSPDSPNFIVEPLNQGARVMWRNNAEMSVDPIAGYEDFEGYNIWRSVDALGWIKIASYDLTNDLGYNAGWPPPASSNADYSYEFVDQGLTNGRPAYYVVTAYDNGDNGDGINTPAFDERNAGVGILESSRGQDVQQLIYPAVSPQSAGTVDQVYVVPNPYIGSSRLEEVPRLNEDGTRSFDKDIEFRNLPGECTIEIYSLGGDLVQTIEHENGLSWEAWDLRTELDQEIHAGIYLYRVFSGDEEHIGKFIVVK